MRARPNELAALVKGVRRVEKALGRPEKRRTASESGMSQWRASLLWRPPSSGELFSDESLTTKRPGTGISPMRWDEVMGRPAPCAFAIDEEVHL